MKERELREVTKCALCDRPFGHAGLPLFWRVRVQRYGVDAKAMRRQDGLAALIGSSAIAQAMGPDEDMAKVISEAEVTVCEPCALKPPMILFQLLEAAPEKYPDGENENATKTAG